MFPGTYAATTPDKPAVIMAGSGATMTFAELDAAANRLSHYFRDVGLGLGDHVAFCLENHPLYHEIAWGSAYAALTYTAMSSRLTTEEAAYILDDSGSRIFITSAYKREMAAELAGKVPGVERSLMLDGVIDGFESYEDAVRDESAEPLPDPR